jgi:hypothetical protein
MPCPFSICPPGIEQAGDDCEKATNRNALLLLLSLIDRAKTLENIDISSAHRYSAQSDSPSSQARFLEILDTTQAIMNAVFDMKSPSQI